MVPVPPLPTIRVRSLLRCAGHVGHAGRVPANKSGRMFAFGAASVIIRDDVFQARDVRFLLSITLMSLVDSSNQEFYGRNKFPVIYSRMRKISTNPKSCCSE